METHLDVRVHDPAELAAVGVSLHRQHEPTAWPVVSPGKEAKQLC